jgi:hypothetical protein
MRIQFILLLLVALVCSAAGAQSINSLSCGAIEKEVVADFAAFCSKAGGHTTDKIEPCDGGCTLPGNTWAYITKKGSSGPLCGHSDVQYGIPSNPISVSHIHVCLKDKEPPPCEIGDPCWCAPEGPGYPCKPPEVCPSDIRFTFDYVLFGFTSNLGATAQEACDGDDVFVGKPGDQVLWGACVNGVATGTGAEVFSPMLPFTETGITTVGQVSTVVSGGVEVLYGNRDFADCTFSAPARWTGAVAADTGTDVCTPDTPEICDWCAEVDDPRCDPPPRCEAYATLRINAVLGHDEEACFAGLQEGDVSLPLLLPEQPATICWEGKGGPEDLNVRAVYDTVPFPDLPARGFAHTWVHHPLKGSITTSARGLDRCYQAKSWRFEFGVVPDICLPFIN